MTSITLAHLFIFGPSLAISFVSIFRHAYGEQLNSAAAIRRRHGRA